MCGTQADEHQEWFYHLVAMKFVPLLRGPVELALPTRARKELSVWVFLFRLSLDQRDL